jgi:hypothetical protein
VRPGTIVLCHSPLTTSAAWGDLARELERRGRRTLVIDVQKDEQPPYAMSYVAHAATQLASVARTDAVVLVGHSGAGPLLPRIGFARRAAHSAVGAYVFFDASLPGAGMMTRLELLRQEDPQSADELGVLLDAGGRFPNWGDGSLLAFARPRGKDFFTEPLPNPTDWPDAPVAYVRTSDAYRWHAGVARSRGWAVVERDLSHFAGVTHPSVAVEALDEALAALPG